MCCFKVTGLSNSPPLAAVIYTLLSILFIISVFINYMLSALCLYFMYAPLTQDIFLVCVNTW